jgi:hypothetical protein
VGDKHIPNPTEGDKLTTKTIHMWGINLHPTEGDKLTLKLNQNYLLVGDKPTHIPTER